MHKNHKSAIVYKQTKKNKHAAVTIVRNLFSIGDQSNPRNHVEFFEWIVEANGRLISNELWIRFCFVETVLLFSDSSIK